MADTDNDNTNPGTNHQEVIDQLKQENAALKKEVSGKTVAYERVKAEKEKVVQDWNNAKQQMLDNPDMAVEYFSQVAESKGMKVNAPRPASMRPNPLDPEGEVKPAGDDVPEWAKRMQNENKLLRLSLQKLAKGQQDLHGNLIKVEDTRLRSVLGQQISDLTKDFKFKSERQRAKLFNEVYNEIATEREDGEKPSVSDVVKQHLDDYAAAPAEVTPPPPTPEERAAKVREVNTPVGSPSSGLDMGGEPEKDDGPLTWEKYEKRRQDREKQALQILNTPEYNEGQVPVS